MLNTDNSHNTASSPRTRAIFVVGAGRSGTSAITRGLQALGVELGDKLKAPTAKNPTGFFEDQDLLAIAKRARTLLGLRTQSVALIDSAQWANRDLEPVCAEAVATIERRFCDYPLWSFKYAQTLRMLPFWQQVFERARVDAAYVVATRNPLSIARSRKKLDPLRGIQEKSDLEWLVNVVPYFRQLAERPFVVVDYDQLMADPAQQLQRIASALVIPTGATTDEAVRSYVDSFLQPDMRHTHFDDADLMADVRLNPLTRDAYRWLRRLANDEIDAANGAFRDDWARIERELAAMAPALRHIDHLEAKVRRSQGNPLRKALGKLGRG